MGKAIKTQPGASQGDKTSILRDRLAGPEDWVGRQAVDYQPIVYQGCHETDARTLLEGGIKAYCLSYYNVEYGSPAALLRHPGFSNPECRAFLDSGAFSFLVQQAKAATSGAALSESEMERKVDTYIQHYAAWVLQHGEEKFDFHITFDYRVSAPLVYKVTKQLRDMGLRPTPVYHGDSSISWLHRYIDEGFPLICLSKRFFLNDRRGLFRYYDHVFNICEKHNVALHGLACTGREAWMYPWWSVDSTSLVKDAGNGVLTYWDSKNKQCKIPVSKSNIGTVGSELLERITSCDMDINELAEERTKRVLFNAIMLKQFLDSKKVKTWNRKTLF